MNDGQFEENFDQILTVFACFIHEVLIQEAQKVLQSAYPYSDMTYFQETIIPGFRTYWDKSKNYYVRTIDNTQVSLQSILVTDRQPITANNLNPERLKVLLIRFINLKSFEYLREPFPYNPMMILQVWDAVLSKKVGHDILLYSYVEPEKGKKKKGSKQQYIKGTSQILFFNQFTKGLAFLPLGENNQPYRIANRSFILLKEIRNIAGTNHRAVITKKLRAAKQLVQAALQGAEFQQAKIKIFFPYVNYDGHFTLGEIKLASSKQQENEYQINAVSVRIYNPKGGGTPSMMLTEIIESVFGIRPTVQRDYDTTPLVQYDDFFDSSMMVAEMGKGLLDTNTLPDRFNADDISSIRIRLRHLISVAHQSFYIQAMKERDKVLTAEKTELEKIKKELLADIQTHTEQLAKINNVRLIISAFFSIGLIFVATLQMISNRVIQNDNVRYSFDQTFSVLQSFLSFCTTAFSTYLKKKQDKIQKNLDEKIHQQKERFQEIDISQRTHVAEVVVKDLEQQLADKQRLLDNPPENAEQIEVINTEQERLNRIKTEKLQEIAVINAEEGQAGNPFTFWENAADPTTKKSTGKQFSPVSLRMLLQLCFTSGIAISSAGQLMTHTILSDERHREISDAVFTFLCAAMSIIHGSINGYFTIRTKRATDKTQANNLRIETMIKRAENPGRKI